MYWKSSFHGTFCALPPPTLPWATILVVGTRDLSLGCCLGRGLSLFTMDFMWSFQPPLQGTIDMSSWVDLTQPLFKILMHIVQIVKTIPEWKGTCQGQWTRLLGSTWPNHCSRSTGLFYKFTCPLCESWKPLHYRMCWATGYWAYFTAHYKTFGASPYQDLPKFFTCT